jgi:hypothetical protein
MNSSPKSEPRLLPGVLALLPVLLMGVFVGVLGAATPGPAVTFAPGPSPATAQTQPDTSGLIPFQTEIVKKLAGGAEIAPGVTLENRGSPENRTVVRSYLEETLRSLGLEPQRQPYRENGENVFALLAATSESSGYVVLGGHFDSVSRAPGANDNATGCAAVLAVARHLIGLVERAVNVYVVLFDEEEGGLRGSRAFAEKLQAEGKVVVAVHTIDQMGWDEDGDGAIELEIPYDGAVELYRKAAEAAGFTGQIHVTEESGSDHSAFRRLGMPAVGLTEEYRNGDTTPHIHRPGDTWDTVNFQYLANSTRLLQAAMEILLKG